MQYLRKATAATIMFGPFVDKTDGVTLKTDSTTITDIDHASTGIFLSKAGAAAAIRHATVTASIADAYGMMKVTLDTTDTGTTGTLDVLFAKAATYLPVSKQFEVLEQVVYDVLFGTVALATTTNITAGTIATVTTLTNLPAVTTDWLTAAGVKADAVTKIQNGLATPTNITAASGVALSATQASYAPAKAGDAMSLTGDLTATMKTSVTTAATAATPTAAAVTANVNADVKKVNGTTVNGTGTAGNPWGP